MLTTHDEVKQTGSGPEQILGVLTPIICCLTLEAFNLLPYNPDCNKNIFRNIFDYVSLE